MSFEINWEKLKDGDGDALSETIRAFLDQRFKEMTLPSYLKSISVSSFDLGSVAPDIEIRRITNPFEEFYMEDEDGDSATASGSSGDERERVRLRVERDLRDSDVQSTTELSTISEPPAYETDESESGYPTGLSQLAPQPLSPAPATAAALGALPSSFNNGLYAPTPNLHFISGVRSPFYPPWQSAAPPGHSLPLFSVLPRNSVSETSSTRGASPDPTAANLDQRLETSPTENPEERDRSDPEKDNDIQLYLQITYKGDLKVGIETTLLLNYPSPNFVSLPLKLTITGLEISSIAALAYIERRIHFSFICDVDSNGNAVTLSGHDRVEIIKDIKIESEIGDKEGNGPVLRNVGKIEKFLLDRLRHLARDELAWPGWITVEI